SKLSDRVVTGAVRDVFAVQRVVLNLADLALVAGVVGWLVCTSGRRRERVSASGLEIAVRARRPCGGGGARSRRVGPPGVLLWRRSPSRARDGTGAWLPGRSRPCRC